MDSTEVATGQAQPFDVSPASLARLETSLREMVQQRQELDRAIAMQEGGIVLMRMLLAEQDKAGQGSGE